MATLNINGQKVKVDDSFLSLSPEQQNATVDEISKSLPAMHGATGSGVPAAPASHNDGALNADNVVRSIANGMTFGLADRFAAAANAVIPLDEGAKFGDYSGNLKRQQQKTNAFREEHPVVSAVGNIAGNVATLPLLPQKLTGAVLTAPTLAGRIAEGAKAGATLGGLQGAADAPDWSDLGRTTVGAGGGAGFGGALPVVGRALGAAGSALADQLRDYGPGISGPVGRSLAKALKYSYPGEVDQSFDRLGDRGMFLDVSPALRGKGQGILQNPEARQIVETALEDRNRGTSNRLLGTVQKHLGPTQPPLLAQAEVEANMAKADLGNYGNALGPYQGELQPDNGVDTASVIGWLHKAIPFAEGGEKKALQRLRDSLHMPNPQAPEAPPKPSDYVVPTPKEKVQGIRAFVKGLGGVMDEGGDLKSAELGHVGLINKRGLPMDKAREAAAEAGYFDHLYGNPDEAVANSTVNDLIDAIHENRTPMRDMGIEATRDAAREQRAGKTQREFWDEMRGLANEATPPVTVPNTNPINIHKLRQELDNLIEGKGEGLGVNPSAVSRKNVALVEARQKLDEALKQIPGMSQADADHAMLAGRIEALKGGHSVFRGKPGEPTLWPEELQARLDAMTPEEQDYFRKGARASIEEKFRTTANDLTAGKQIAGGENDFRRDLMGKVFGDWNTRPVLNAVEREKQFADTYNRLIRNSETAARSAAMKEEAPMKVGKLSILKHALVDPVPSRITEGLPGHQQYYRDMAKVLTSRGQERDRYRRILADALLKGKETSERSNRRGNQAALAAALMLGHGGRQVALPVIDVPGR